MTLGLKLTRALSLSPYLSGRKRSGKMAYYAQFMALLCFVILGRKQDVVSHVPRGEICFPCEMSQGKQIQQSSIQLSEKDQPLQQLCHQVGYYSRMHENSAKKTKKAGCLWEPAGRWA